MSDTNPALQGPLHKLYQFISAQVTAARHDESLTVRDIADSIITEVERWRPEIEFSEDEKRVNALIVEVLQGIINLNGRKLAANENELIPAIHVLQSFVLQAAHRRLGIFDASDWWTDVEGDGNAD